VAKSDVNSLAKALEANQASFRTLADSLPHLVWLARADGVIEFVNRGWIDYTGTAADDINIPGFQGVVHDEDVGRTWERWRDALATGSPYEIEYRLRRGSDGAYRWFLARAVPLRDAAGRADFWIGTATDIDAQKHATESLNFVLEAVQLFTTAQSVDAVCKDFARLSVQRFADWCFVVLKDPHVHYRVVGFAHADPERVHFIERVMHLYPIGDDPRLGEIIAAGKPLVVPVVSDEMMVDAAKDERHLGILREMGLHSVIVAPLVAEGEPLGAIEVFSSESRRVFSDDDAEVMTMLADRVAACISTLRRLGEERRQKQRLQFIGRAMQTVHESFDVTSTFGNLAELIVTQLADMAAVFRIEGDNTVRVVGAAHHDPAGDEIARSLVGVRVMHGDAEKRFVQALATRKPLIGRNLHPERLVKSVWPYLAAEIRELQPHALVTIPLHSRGKTYGALIAYQTAADRDFKSEDVEILVEVARHASVAMENAEVFEHERRMAETLQESLLPQSFPELDDMSFDAVYLPSSSEAQVGGDWYDAFRLPDGTVVVTAGDVTGRGVEAAVIMAKVRHFLAIAPSYDRDPAHVLDTVEAVLARRYPESIVTAFVGFIDPARRTMTYANAGHPPPILRRSETVEEVRADGLPIGLRREAAPTPSQTIDLHDAKMLVVYTDGLVESRHDVLGGHRRLLSVLRRDAVLHTHRPARFIEESCLDEESDDDVAVLAISFEPAVRWSFDAENAKAAQDARGEFVAYLSEHIDDVIAIQTAELIFGELVGNVVRHAPGAIDIDVEWRNGSPTLHVLDRGAAFTQPAALPLDVLSESGRGLYIVSALSKMLRIEHVPGYGNHVTVELPLREKA
jgi:PAS domain S-box-containing protein